MAQPESAGVALPVIVLNWNHAAQTASCISRLKAWRALRAEVWLIDNGSADDRAALVAMQPDHLVLHAHNLGFAGGHNDVLRSLCDDARHSHVLLLNADASLDGHAAARMLAAARADARLAALGPLIQPQGPGVPAALQAGGVVPTHAVNTHVPARVATAGLHRVAYVPGTAALLSCAALRDVGVFDPAFFFSGEMADWCRRAARRGWRSAILGGCVAQHVVQAHAPALEQLRLHYTLRNRWLYAAKHGGAGHWLPRHVWLIARRCLRGDAVRARVMWGALVCGVLGQYGNHNRRFGLA